MKNALGLLVCALSLLAFASTAQSGGAEASGDFTFDLGTAAGTTNLFGQLRNDGTVNGQISFNAAIDVSGEVCVEDVCEPSGQTDDSYSCVSECEGPPPPPNVVSMFRENVALNFLIDRMVLDGSRACMSGHIQDESSPFNGLHTILAVENASGNDGFTWGVYATKHVNIHAKDYDVCPANPALNRDPEVDFCLVGEVEGQPQYGTCPAPAFCYQTVEGPSGTEDSGAGLQYVASDYELCPYPPPSETQNNVPEDPRPGHYTCYTGAADPNGRLAGIPVEADEAHTITRCTSFPIFSYPMTPIPHGGGNKLTVKNNS